MENHILARVRLFNEANPRPRADAIDAEMGFEDLIFYLEKIYREEVYAQHYERKILEDNSYLILMKPIQNPPIRHIGKKISCHWVIYAEQAVGFLMGVFDFLNIIGMKNQENFANTKQILKDKLKELMVCLKTVSIVDGHRVFNAKLEVFQDDVKQLLKDNQVVKDYLRQHSVLMRRQDQYLKACLSEARLWAPLNLKPQSIAVQDAKGGVSLYCPVIEKAPLVYTQKGGFKNQLLVCHQENLKAGRIIPTQLVQDLHNLPIRNAWMVSQFDAGQNLQGRYLRSGMYDLNSVGEAGKVFNQTQKLAKSYGYSEVRPMSLVTKSVFREKTASKVYEKLSHQDKQFRFLQSPLFNRKICGSVKDSPTEALINHWFDLLTPDIKRQVNSVRAFLNLPLREYYFAKAGYLESSEAVQDIQDPKIKKMLYAILAWKALAFNDFAKGHEPIPTILDEFRDQMDGQRPIYHTWQLAINAMIHEMAGVLPNIQCKSGKDRTGLAAVCHEILGEFYDPRVGFIAPKDQQDKSRVENFKIARQKAILDGSSQLMASVGGTLGAHGIMKNGDIKAVLPRILGLKNNDVLAQSLISKAANNRKELKFNHQEKKRLDKIKLLLDIVSHIQTQAPNTRLEQRGYEKVLSENLNWFSFGCATTNSVQCVQALGLLFQSKAEQDKASEQRKPMRKEAEVLFCKVLNASRSLSRQEKHDYRQQFEQSLKSLG